MKGWTAAGREVRLYPEQAYVVKVLLGLEEPHGGFDRFWRTRGIGKTVALVTAARYAERQAEHDAVMHGLHLDPKIHDHDLHALGATEIQRIAKEDPARISAPFRSGNLRGCAPPLE